MRPILFNIDGLHFPSQLIFVFLGLLLALIMLLYHGRRAGVHWKILIDSYLMVLVGSLVVGRLFVVLQEPVWFFQEHPGQIWRLYVGGVSLYGGILGGLVAAWGITYWYSARLWRLTDELAVAFTLALAVGYFGAFLHGVGFGKMTSGGMGISTTDPLAFMPLEFARYPVQLCMALFLALLHVVLLSITNLKMFDGQYTALFFIGLPFFDSVLIPWRDTAAAKPFLNLQIAGFELTLDRLAALALLVFGIFLFRSLRNRRLSAA